MVSWIKNGRRIQLIHWFRRYSALSVVISSAFVVTGTNIAISHNPSQFAFGSGGIDLGHDQFTLSASAKSNLSFMPLASASGTVDPTNKEDLLPVVVPSTDQFAVAAQQSPVLKDPEEDGGVKIYTVNTGDTVGSIATKNHITVNTILWANDLENADAIKPGDQIFILPVAGLSYTVKDGDTIESIAKQFTAEEDKIISFNSLPANGRLDNGQQIIIPDGKREVAKPAPTANSSLAQGLAPRQYSTTDDTTSSTGGKSVLGTSGGGGHRFPYGYCTWYVAQKRSVPWGGNAGTWLYNAKANGYKTGKTPVSGAIVVTTESAYYGHVALVESVGGGMITVSEMNYKGWGKVDRRTIPASSGFIKGYIY